MLSLRGCCRSPLALLPLITPSASPPPPGTAVSAAYTYLEGAKNGMRDEFVPEDRREYVAQVTSSTPDHANTGQGFSGQDRAEKDRIG